jgi:hypothetical protein
LNARGFIGHHIDVCEMDQFKTRMYIREDAKTARPATPKQIKQEKERQKNLAKK